MTDHSDLIERLRAACVGHPSASIAWPHRILHEAVDALSSQSLSLSEARNENDRKDVEIERLKGLVAGIRECPQETITGVALLYDDGRIIALPRPHRHHHLYAFAAFIGQQPDEHESGFTTSTGRYVDREEAQRICVAAGQPNRRSGSQHDPKLYSEDVW